MVSNGSRSDETKKYQITSTKSQINIKFMTPNFPSALGILNFAYWELFDF